MPQGLIQPNNSIVYAGYPKYMEYEIKTATDCYPGRLVITDTNEWCVKVAGDGATTVLGVLDVEPNELRETIYGTGDQARVITGDCIVMLQKTSGATIAIGTRVEAAPSGRVSELADEDAEIGYSLQAASGDDHEWILVKLTI